MQDTTEGTPQSFPNTGPELGHEIQEVGSDEDGLRTLKVGESIVRIEPIALRSAIGRDEQKKREAEIKRCAKLGFTVDQICRFSETWEFPMRDPSSVRKKLKKKPKVRVKRWQEEHERSLIESFIVIVASMKADGWILGHYAKEEPLGYGIPARCDMEMRFTKEGERIRFLERQRGALDRRRLAGKVMAYRRLYEETKELFRVLFVVETEAELSKCVDVVNDVLRDKPDLELALVSLDGIAWVNRWGQEKKVA